MLWKLYYFGYPSYSDISEKGLFGPELYREDIVIDGKTWKEDYDLGGELE